MAQGDMVRPTRHSLNQLGVPVPTIDVVLSELKNDPLPAAQSFPQRFEAGGLSRIRSLKDRVWFKLKTSRWRGAVVRLTDADLHREAEGDDRDLGLTRGHRWWLGAVGSREDGSRSDFYAQVSAASACPVSPEKKDGIDTDLFLPQGWDRVRLRAEKAYAEQRLYQKIMIDLTARSLRSGKVFQADFPHFSMAIVVRADRPEQFVAFIVENVVDPRRLAAMMAALPGIAPTDWGPEPGGIADLQPQPGQIIWSAVLPTDVADHILDLVPWTEDTP